MNFKEALEKKVVHVEEILGSFLPKEEGFQKVVLEAMNYSIMAGGKRLRPIMMEESYHLLGGRGKIVEPFMAALEMIHNYSLVHDDLPAMDNDEYRRGRKTTWKVYGDGMAVLAGDGLLNYAYETAVTAFSMTEDREELKRVARALEVLTRKAGVYGMIGGQTADIEAESKEQITEELLLFIDENKTAALMQAAFMIGGILAGASEEAINKLERAAYDIGIAFQIQDDILDVTSTTEVLGKPVGSDEKNHKLTYVSLHGLDRAKEEVCRLSGDAVHILKGLGEENDFLIELIHSLIKREK